MKQKPTELQWNIHSLKEGVNRFHLILSARKLELHLDDAHLQGSIDCEVTLTKHGTKIILDGSASFSLVLECARCFEEFTFHGKESVSAYYLPEKAKDEEREALSQDDVMTEYYQNDTIDMQPLLYDTMALSKPMKPLCKETCKGLCPICGQNLNTAPCECKRNNTDPRWEPLKKLMK